MLYVPAADATAVMIAVRLAPAATVPKLHVTLAPPDPRVQAGLSTAVAVMPVGMGSVTALLAMAVTAWLVTVTVKLKLSPGTRVALEAVLVKVGVLGVCMAPVAHKGSKVSGTGQPAIEHPSMLLHGLFADLHNTAGSIDATVPKVMLHLQT